MPRIEELAGWRFAVADTAALDIDPDTGQPRLDDTGQPQTIPAKLLVFFEPVESGPNQVTMGDQVKVMLTEDAKNELIRQLTGGIVISNGHLHG